jgi:alginate O-acetyltransferase complex protein AlgI
MLFNSLQFLFFFGIVTIVYFLLPNKLRWIHLLLASCYFYMVFIPAYILILGFTIIVDYIAGIMISKSEGGRRKLFLIFSLIANIGMLAFFKYYNFFNDNISEGLTIFGTTSPLPHLSILLPIGLSFHTFQAVSYTIEVYRKNCPAERNFVTYALYVMFFPQLVAGPIERPNNLLPQFHAKHDFDVERLKSGLMQMAFGFFKKVVIADRLAIVVDQAYGNISLQNGSTLAIATVCYAFQIYCDFSGYTDIAIGAARILGIKLMDNFNMPYLARSVTDFWKRWHISLSSWLRDYLFMPLSLNMRNTRLGLYVALLITFLVCGLWHGANWNFLIWGLIHGVFMVLNVIIDIIKKRKKISLLKNGTGKVISTLFTFLVVCFAWIFFRSTTITEAGQIIKKIGNISLRDELHFALNNVEMIFCLALIVLMVLKEKYLVKIPTRNTFLFVLLFLLIAFGSYLFGVFNNKQFIYFQF